MKRFLIVLAVLLAVVLPAAAQDFSSPNPQFIAFNLGVALGPEFSNNGGFAGGSNFGFDFAVLDNLTVGFDSIATRSNGNSTVTRAYNGLRLGYTFTPRIGAALGIGSTGAASNTITLGLVVNLLNNRSSAGFAYGLKLRADYVAQTNALDTGALLFVVGYSFGL
jgi:opacity protein-like surface antigen